MSELNFALRKNAALSMLSFIANVVVVFVGYRLIIKFHGLETLGLWSLLMSWSYLARLGDLGLSSSAARLTARLGRKKSHNLLKNTVAVGLSLHISASGTVSGLIGLVLLALVPKELVPLVPGAVAFVFLAMINLHVGGILQGLHKGFLSAYSNLLGLCINVICLLFLAETLGIVALLLGGIAQTTVSLIVNIRWVSNTLGLPGLWPKRHKFWIARCILSYSLKIHVLNFTNGFFEPLSKLLVARVAGAEALGLYEMALKLVVLPRNALMSAIHAGLPALTISVSENSAELPFKYRHASCISLRSFLGLSSFTVGLSPLISLFWMDSFDQTFVGLVAILSIGYFGNSVGAPAYMLGLAKGRLAVNFIGASVTLLILAGCFLLPTTLLSIWTSTSLIAAILTVSALFVRWQNEAKLLPCMPT